MGLGWVIAVVVGAAGLEGGVPLLLGGLGLGLLDLGLLLLLRRLALLLSMSLNLTLTLLLLGLGPRLRLLLETQLQLPRHALRLPHLALHVVARLVGLAPLEVRFVHLLLDRVAVAGLGRHGEVRPRRDDGAAAAVVVAAGVEACQGC